jgi:RNA polymerase sigma factor (sigma-70 family)
MPTAPQQMAQAYEQHRDGLLSFFRTLARRKDHVEDLVQEVYVSLIRFPPREVVKDPAAYLYKVAWHLLQRYNKAARRAPVACDPGVIAQLAHNPLDDAAAELAAEEHLVSLLRELPPQYGAVLILNRRDGLDCAQIAQRLNISVPQVRRYLGATLAHLKKARWND